MALDDVTLLRLFVRVIEAGSITAAAQSLNLSVPMASKRLRQLESGLGIRLLQRTTRRQSLTPEGELLYAKAVAIIEQLDQVQQQLHHQSEAVSGLLRVAAPVALGRRVIAPLAADFCVLHPLMQVQVELSDTLIDLVEAGMDVAVRFGGLHDSSYISRPLAPNYRVLCAAPVYLRRHGMPRTPQDLARHQCLHIGPHSQADWPFDGKHPMSVRIQALLTSNDGDVVHQWALDGHGIALKSVWDVGHDLKSGRLQQVLPGYRITAAPLHAIYPHRQHVAPRVRAFLDHLATRLAELDQGSSAIEQGA